MASASALRSRGAGPPTAPPESQELHPCAGLGRENLVGDEEPLACEASVASVAAGGLCNRQTRDAGDIDPSLGMPEVISALHVEPHAGRSAHGSC
jgi:hypothetical protein